MVDATPIWSFIMNTLYSFLTNEEGATMVEYAIMVALIASVCFLAAQALGLSLPPVFDSAANSLGNAI